MKKGYPQTTKIKTHILKLPYTCYWTLQIVNRKLYNQRSIIFMGLLASV